MSSTPKVKTSTVVLSLVFLLALVTYTYLHGVANFEIFDRTPTTSTVQPIPVIPWDEYQQQVSPHSTTHTPPVSDTTTPKEPAEEPTVEPTASSTPTGIFDTPDRPTLEITHPPITNPGGGN